MPEIDRVNNVIESHFKVYGDPRKHPKEMAQLADQIDRCAWMAEIRYAEKKMDDEGIANLIREAQATISVLKNATEDHTMEHTIADILAQAAGPGAAPPPVPPGFSPGATTADILTAEAFKAAAEKAMTARRATYPLDGDTPWEKKDPRDALYDDDDIHSWAIFDSMIEPIQELLPPLYQLACEDYEDPPKETDED